MPINPLWRQAFEHPAIPCKTLRYIGSLIEKHTKTTKA